MMSTEPEQLWGPEEEQALLDSIDHWVEKSVAPIAQDQPHRMHKQIHAHETLQAQM